MKIMLRSNNQIIDNTLLRNRVVLYTHNPKIARGDGVVFTIIEAEQLENTDGLGLENTDGTILENTGV